MKKDIRREKAKIKKPGRLPCQLMGLLLFWGTTLSAQAPTDEWRRGGFDAMVAEPGQAASILSNPAGITTKEERHSISEDKERPGKKYEWITEIVSADMFLTADTWTLLENPAMIPSKTISVWALLPSVSKFFQGDLSGVNCECEIVDIMRNLEPWAYQQLTHQTGLPSDQMKLTVDHIENIQDIQRKALERNLENHPKSLPKAIVDVLERKFMDDVQGLGFEHYSRTLSLGHVNDQKPVAWGFYFGLEQKATFRSNTKSVSVPLSLKFQNFSVETEIPIGFQAYLLAPFRLAFASDFGETLPGFTFGIGLKAVPYLGVNQTTWGNFISESIAFSDMELDKELLSNSLISSMGINLGLDFGVQYHFGAILPQLEFLHTGLKISDLLGFNVPLSERGDTTRYALDFDWGIYAEHQFPQYLQVFGGFEIIQLRGLFPGGQSPYSALFDPIDHLRFLFGLELFDNALGFTVQYYNSNLSPGITLNLGPYQFQTAVNINTTVEGFWGLELGFRFRSPHDGFNKRTPYRTYTPRSRKKTRQNSGAENNEIGNNQERNSLSFIKGYNVGDAKFHDEKFETENNEIGNNQERNSLSFIKGYNVGDAKFHDKRLEAGIKEEGDPIPFIWLLVLLLHLLLSVWFRYSVMLDIMRAKELIHERIGT